MWTSHLARLKLIEPLPKGVTGANGPAQATTALVFADDAASLSQANRADINRDTLWPILGEYGMRPIRQIALDEFWSAMRFRANKEGGAPFTGGTKS